MININRYNDRMRKGLQEKLFFLDYVKDTNTYVDYGCADGTLLSAMKELNPNKVYLGFDNSEEQLKIEKSMHPYIPAFSDWSAIQSYIARKDATLILSSVIHEVYSYSNAAEIKEFWRRVFESNFKYIAIRDMTISAKNAFEIIDLPSVEKIRGHVQYTEMLEEFETKWGKIDIGKNYLHWLLKFHYRDNWLHENSENYLPICMDTLLELIPDTYRIPYMEQSQLPYLRWKAKETFGIDMKFPSHIKLLLERK